jgi:cytochrome c
MIFNIRRLLAVAVAAAALTLSAQVPAADEPGGKVVAFTVDSDAAESLARREGCLKCHGVTKDKEGPSFRKVASKFKDKPDPNARLLKHITSGEMVKFSDGEEEEHRIIKTRDENALANLIQWILSR